MMLESISDYISLSIILAFPISLMIVALNGFMKKRKAKILANSEKYYREW